MTKQTDLPLTSEDFAELDELLFSFANQSNEAGIILNVSELDGFLTAMLSSVETVAPSEWLQVLFNHNTPDLTDKRAERFMDLLFRHYNAIATALRNDPKNYLPLFWEDRFGRRKFVVMSPWCGGYVIGSMLAQWQLPAEMQPHFDLIKAQAELQHFEELPPLVEQRKTEKALKNAVVAIFEHANQNAPLMEKQQPYVNKNKIGVNEPCPCGSGKKYKKCCMNK